MVNESFLFGILGTASSGLATLLSVGLAVVGLVYVRRVNMLAGLCFAGAGLLGAFGSLIQRLASLTMTIGGAGTSIYTISQIFTTLLGIVGGLLIPVGIFLLANTIKQNAQPNP